MIELIPVYCDKCDKFDGDNCIKYDDDLSDAIDKCIKDDFKYHKEKEK